MIARMWRGWVHTGRIDGYVDTVALGWWDDLDVIRAFAGDDIELAKYYPEDDEFLVDRETHVSHFVVAPGWTAPTA